MSGIRAHLAAVIDAIESGGVENKMTIVRTAVAEGSAVHEIDRSARKEIRHKAIQDIRIVSMGQAITFNGECSDYQAPARFGFSGAAEQGLPKTEVAPLPLP